MNRTILTVAGVLSASSLLLVDSAIKGTVLLAVAAVAALILRRDSAATRHLVWLLAIVAMLVVPVLSAMLPQWRVLPTWMSSSRPVVADVSPSSVGKSTGGVIETPRMAEPFEVERPIATADQRVSALPDSQPAPATRAMVPAPGVRSWNWINALPLVWVVGFAVLMLRLSAARWMLGNSERRATVISLSPRGVGFQPADEDEEMSGRLEAYPTTGDSIVAAMETICSQLGIGRPVTLLIHPDKTIPVVWGILRCRLMLPAAARQWSDEQLQSVLLHELAHIKRRDTIVQLLAQVACALHWFNPLVWFAAWRLDVERERSCDDLVLATGIRPSAYAGHLLDVVTGLSPARWTQACGLAMARKSSLEGRLTAVLGKDLNRRDVSLALAGLALAIAVGIAVPIAMLRAADEKWNPPRAAHIGTNDFSAYCVHDGKDASFVIAYHGDFGSATESVANPKTRTWTDSGTLTAKKPGIALSFHRVHTAPGKLSITTAPSEGRDLGKPVPPPRDFGQKEYDLAKGRVFLLGDSGDVRQLDIAIPAVTDQESAKKLATLIAAIPPQQREDAIKNPKTAMKLPPETIAKLKWGEPVNGLRMALAWPPALGEALLGEEPFFQLVVQNVSEKEVRFIASDETPNPRELVFRAENRTVLVLGDEQVSAVDWHLQPGHCGVLRMFMKEMHGYYGTVSAGIERDLSKIDGNLAVAEMEVAKAPAGAWTGTLITGQTRGSADVVAAPAPMHKDARTLYEVWQRHARANGDIPGALVGELAAAVRQFIKYNPTWETVPKLNQLLPRLDATHDWKPADAIALLDEVAAVKDSPLTPAPWKGTRHTIRQGEALPKKFADASWGEAQPNGLRAAWVLEPGGVEHRIGSALKARLLVQNTGRVPVVLQVPTFHEGGVTARDAKDAEVEVSGIYWTRLAQLVPVRLGPGEFIEINTLGVGFGPRAGMGPWAGPRVGSNVLAKPGDELTLTYSPVPLDGSDVGMSEDDPHVVGAGWWLAHIKTRLGRELPLPADADERTRLLDRAVRELFATAPSAEETSAFIADKTPDALDALAKRLAARVDVMSFSGKLPTAPAKFRVLAADPAADKRPRVVIGPGEYPLSEGTADRGAVTLKIVGRSVGDRRTNDAQLLFNATEATGKLPPDPHKLEIPDSWGTWAIVCRPGSGVFYLLSKGAVRKIDYSDPGKVTDTPANDLPAEFRDEVKRILDIHEISAAQQAEIFEKPAAPAATPDSKTGANAPAKPTKAGTPKLPKLPDDAYAMRGVHWQKFREEDAKRPGGELMGDVAWNGERPLEIGLRVAKDAKWNVGGQARVDLLIRNLGGSDLKFTQTPRTDNGLSVVAIDKDGKEYRAEFKQIEIDRLLVMDRLLLPAFHTARVKSFTLRFDPVKRGVSERDVAAFHLPPGKYKLRCTWNDARPDVAHEGEWTGELVNEELEFTLAAAVAAQPVSEAPKATEKKPFTAWGEEVNGVQIGVQLGEPRTYEVGESATLILRLRNKGKVQVPYRFGDEYFLKNPPLITDASGKAVTIKAMSVFGSVREESVAPGKEVELVQLKLDLRPATDRSKDAAWTLYGTGKCQIQYPVAGVVGEVGPDLPGMKLTTGKLELEVKEPFTAWGEAINGLQAGLGFKAGGKRVYTHGDAATLQGETATLVVRLRNVGKEEIKFQYLRQYFIENPPTVTNAKGKLNQLGKVDAFGEHIPQEVKLAPGKEIELYEWKPYLGSGNEEGMPKYPYIFGAGKFQVQYEKVFGNSSAGTIKLNPALEKLATGKLELEVKAPEKAPVEKEAFTAWGKEVGGLQAGLGFKAGEQRVYTHSETAALVVRVRNIGKEPVKFEYLRQFLFENPPTVTDDKGKPVWLGEKFIELQKRHIPVEANLAAGKEVELCELKLELSSGAGLGIQKFPTILGTGKFQFQYEKVLGNTSSGSIKLDPALGKLATGKLELEVQEALPQQPANAGAAPPANAEAEPAKPKPNYVKVVGQLLDDETGRPIEHSAWEWGQGDPQKPDQIAWGHTRQGGDHPDGKFVLPVNIGADGRHHPLRVYAAGYQTAIVVGELAKPYPEQIERIVRLKRGRSITGVLRDHKGQPVANGWVFFIPKGHSTNIVEGVPGTDAHQLPGKASDGAVTEVRTNANGTFSLPTGVGGTLAASTDLVDLWPFPLPDDGHADLKMPAPSYLVIDLSYWYLDDRAKKGKRAISPDSEDPNQCWLQVDQLGSTEPLWKNLGYRRQMLVFANDPRAKLSKGVVVGQVIEGEMPQPIPGVGHNKNLATVLRVALPAGTYRVQRLRAGPFAPVVEQQVELKAGEDTKVSWSRGDGSSVRGKATWPANMMFVRQPGEAPRKLDWTVPDTATVWIAPVGADGKQGQPIETAKIQAEGSFFIATNLDPGKYTATARVYLPESDVARVTDRWRGPDCVYSTDFTVPEPARGPFGSPPVEVEIKLEVRADGGRFVAADPPKTETAKGADAAAPFRHKLAELDAKIAALKMERAKLSETLSPNHPKIRKLDAEVETFEEARASFIATNPQALSPKPPEAPKPLLPPPPAASVAQPLPEFVFARRDWSRSAKVAVADGVTVAIHEEVINRADIMATARIRYTAADGTVTGHDLLLASDVAGSRAKWAYGWMRGAKTFWYCSVSPDNSYSLHRVSFADPQRITDDYQQYYPGEKPRRTLGVPDAFHAQLVDVLGFQKWTVVDKSNGLPEISGQNVVSAQPLTPAGVPVKAATVSPLPKDNRWQVQFVDAATDQPVSRLRATVTSRTADGSRTTNVMKVVSDGAFERNLNADEHAWVSVMDEAWANADDDVRLFGNVPADVQATEKQTNPKAPFIVKVKPRVKTADANPPKPRIEHVDVALEKDGTLYLNRKKVTLHELKAQAAKDEKKEFTIRANKDVPYAKVIEVVETLKAAGVTEFSFSEACVGDGKYRVANRTGTYEFDDKHGFSICRPSERPQWFTVSWPAEGDRPACALRTFPNVSDKTDGKWAVVWEPGTDVLWWVDDSEVGKMTLTDPARVIVDREGRTNNFSRDFGLPEEVKTEFRRLGFVIGRDKTPGLETAIGGNSGGQTIVSAELGWWCIEGTVTDADGKPLANVPVRVSTNQEVKTEKTDAKGTYRVNFSLPLQLLAHSRAVTVKPVLEGFTERDMAKSGEFNVLLRAGEEPQRVRLADDKDFQPGPIPRFAERDLLPSQHGVFPGKPGRADFVMIKAGEITSEIVPADGSGKAPVKVEAGAPSEGGAALKPDANAAVRVVDGAAPELRKSPPYNFRDSDQYRALDESSRSRLNTVVDDLAQLERALDSFMKDHDGTPPETLEQLVPKYIVRLPEDPFASPDEKIPDDLKHHQRSLDGRGYLYLQKPGGGTITSYNPLTLKPSPGAWQIQSVGLRTFPLRYEKSNPGLIHTRGYWGRLQLDVF